MNNIPLDVNGVSFIIENQYLLKDINFSVNEGETVALIGTNGSGKSTLIALILEHLHPNSGIIRLYGKPSPFGSKFEHLSFVTNQSPLIPYLTTIENIVYHTTLGDGLFNPKMIAEWMDIFELNKVRNHYSQTLSTGERKRLSLLIAILNDPSLLVLDEPFSNVDPIIIQNIWTFLKSKVSTILYTTHDWSNLKIHATHVIPIYNGLQIHAKVSIENFLKIIPFDYKITIETHETAELISLTPFYFLEESRIILFPENGKETLTKLSEKFAKISMSLKNVEDIYSYLSYRSKNVAFY